VQSPIYRVIVYAAGSSFGVGSTICEFRDPWNIGWAKYLNDVPEAHFTVSQADPAFDTLSRGDIGLAHVQILRDGVTVWRGFLGEHEATGTDVIFYCYGYVAHLYWLITLWNQTWKNEEVGDIVSDLWTTRAKDLADSPLGWVTTGTIEDPVTTSGGVTKLELPSYKLYYKRVLHTLKELTAIATSDTTNICYFEIDHSTTATTHTGTFNFWKNRSDVSSIVLKYGHNVADFGDRYAPILTRNDLRAVGSGASNLLFRKTVNQASGAHGYTLFGRRMEPLYISWTRDERDLERVAKRRLAKALRSDTDLSLRLVPNSLNPTAVRLGDRFPVYIDRGITQIDKDMLMIGLQVYANSGTEYVRPIMLDRGGS
jgi:hypothetical protein